MKRNILFIISCFFILNSCSLDNDTNNDIPEQNITYLWHLVSVSGGISGVNEQFNLNTIVWIFDEENGTVTVDNTNTDSSKEDGLDSGTYSYSILDSDNNSFIIVDGVELGKVSFTSATAFEINQNEMSTGPAADGYIYTFHRTFIVSQ